MRTKVLLCAAICAASVLTAAAQNVYSLNIVGYVNQAVPAGTPTAPSFVLVGNPLAASPNNDVTTVLGTQVPSTGSLLLWNGTGFDENTTPGDGTWDFAADLSPGNGFFVKNTGPAFNVTFVGSVLGGLNTNAMSTAFSLVSPKVPIAGNLQTQPNLNLTNAVTGDSILTWNGTGYDEDVYNGGGAWDFDPVVSVAQGFFYKQQLPVHTVNWITVGLP